MPACPGVRIHGRGWRERAAARSLEQKGEFENGKIMQGNAHIAARGLTSAEGQLIPNSLKIEIFPTPFVRNVDKTDQLAGSEKH